MSYPSDVTDEEWALVEPLVPPAKRGGNRRHVVVREVVNGLMYVLSTGCRGARILRTCRRARRCTIISICGAGTGALDRIHDALYARSAGRPERAKAGRRRDHRQPERLERGKRGPAIDWSGYDAAEGDQGQEAARPRRYTGPADARHRARRDVQDRDGGALLMADLFGAFPFLISSMPTAVTEAGETEARSNGFWRASTSRSSSDRVQATGFVALPERSIVERTVAWLRRCRRLAKD